MSTMMSGPEIDEFCLSAQSLQGSLLQRVLYDEKALQLGFWLPSQKKMSWLTLSLQPQKAFVLLADEIRRIRPQKKPLSEFLSRHGLGARFVGIGRDRLRGRVMQMELLQPESAVTIRIEVILVPGYINVGVQFEERWVWAKKPRPLPGHQDKSDQIVKHRPPEVFLTAWQGETGVHRSLEKKVQDPGLSSLLEKKQKALAKVVSSLSQNQESKWRAAGEWLKENLNFDEVPEPLRAQFSPEKGLAWNLENCFAQARKIRDKQQGTLARQQALESEIQSLQHAISQGAQTWPLSGKSLSTKSRAQESASLGAREGSSLLYKAQAKGRTVRVGESALYLGKSGTDNLKLLRLAKPWYLWFHIRDYPGTFGVLERTKNSGDLSREHLNEIARQVVVASLRERAQGAFDVLYTECRFVRPIKGGKAGQVTYSHERVVRIKVDDGRGQISK